MFSRTFVREHGLTVFMSGPVINLFCNSFSVQTCPFDGLLCLPFYKEIIMFRFKRNLSVITGEIVQNMSDASFMK